MNLLAIETSSAVSSIALLAGPTLAASRAFPSRMSLVRNLALEVEAVLGHLPEGTVLQGLAVSLGPGSFTSLRIGVMTAKALAHRLGLPLVGVPTLEALAAPFSGEPGRTVVALQPAWKDALYCAAYRIGASGETEEVLPPSALEPDALPAHLEAVAGGFVAVGEVVLSHRDELARRLGARAILAAPSLCTPQALFVGHAALSRLPSATPEGVHAVRPLYIVASQAERAAGIDLGLTGR